MVTTVDTPDLENVSDFDIVDWVQKLNVEPEHQDILVQACRVAADAVNRGGNGFNWGDRTNCYLIGLEIAATLNTLNADHETLLAAILYRCVREGRLVKDYVAQHFGEDVAHLIDGVEQMDAVTIGIDTDEGVILGQSQSQVDNLRRMLITIIDDVRVVLLKLAERISALRNLKPYPDRARKVASEVNAIFSPLAHRLGVGHLKWELEDLSFRYTNPSEYARIAKLLDGKRLDRQSYIEKAIETLGVELDKAGIEAEINGRIKHIYSIWRKMKRKQIPFSEVYDIRAVRVMVNTERDCYNVIGHVHRLWLNLPHEFDDYIANPKSNGYQSLHTAVMGPEGKILEIQIRTKDMHLEAEFGVCAHWAYKGADSSKGSADGYEKKIAWLRHVLDWQEEIEGGPTLANLSAEVSEDRIYVFTPKGHVVDLPKNATPIDFAYHIHTEVGHKCRGAKVDGRIVPLTYALKTGQRVSIITANESDPSRDWLRTDLGYVKSGRTRAKIQQWFRLQNRDTNIAMGRSMLNKELKELDVTAIDLVKICEHFSKKSVEELWLAVGAGDITVNQVTKAASKILPQDEEEQLAFCAFKPATAQANAGDIVVQGVGNMLTTLASCCNPVNGDEIIGYVTQSRGVSIHLQDCVNALDLATKHPGRMIKVDWGAENTFYQINLVIEAYDRRGLLGDITSIISWSGVNVNGMSSTTDKATNIATFHFDAEVDGLDTLSSLFAKLQRVPNVLSAKRVRNG